VFFLLFPLFSFFQLSAFRNNECFLRLLLLLFIFMFWTTSGGIGFVLSLRGSGGGEKLSTVPIFRGRLLLILGFESY